MPTSPVSDAMAANASRRSASIIPFPIRPKPAPITPEQRLARALTSLNTALADQKAAVAAWREVIGELKTTTVSLQDSVQRYRANLRVLGNSVTALQSKARALEAWADRATHTTD